MKLLHHNDLNKISQVLNPRTETYTVVDTSNGRILGHLDQPLPVGLCVVKERFGVSIEDEPWNFIDPELIKELDELFKKNREARDKFVEAGLLIKKELTNDEVDYPYQTQTEPTLYNLNSEFDTTDEG
jgi:hypothetical protein